MKTIKLTWKPALKQLRNNKGKTSASVIGGKYRSKGCQQNTNRRTIKIIIQVKDCKIDRDMVVVKIQP